MVGSALQSSRQQKGGTDKTTKSSKHTTTKTVVDFSQTLDSKTAGRLLTDMQHACNNNTTADYMETNSKESRVSKLKTRNGAA